MKKMTERHIENWLVICGVLLLLAIVSLVSVEGGWGYSRGRVVDLLVDNYGERGLATALVQGASPTGTLKQKAYFLVAKDLLGDATPEESARKVRRLPPAMKSILLEAYPEWNSVPLRPILENATAEFE